MIGGRFLRWRSTWQVLFPSCEITSQIYAPSTTLPSCSVIERVPFPGAFWDATTEERMTDAEQKNSSSCSSVAMVTVCGCAK